VGGWGGGGGVTSEGLGKAVTTKGWTVDGSSAQGKKEELRGKKMVRERRFNHVEKGKRRR